MNITAIKISQVQNVAEVTQAVKSQNAQQQETSKLLTQVQGLNIVAMASAIKEAQNTLLNFKGSVDELKKYLMYLALAGEMNVDKESFSRMVKTNDGKTYQVEVRKPNENEKLLLGDDDAITVDAIRKEVNGAKTSEHISPLTVAISPEIVKKAKEELPKMKQKYGEI